MLLECQHTCVCVPGLKLKVLNANARAFSLNWKQIAPIRLLKLSVLRCANGRPLDFYKLFESVETNRTQCSRNARCEARTFSWNARPFSSVELHSLQHWLVSFLFKVTGPRAWRRFELLTPCRALRSSVERWSEDGRRVVCARCMCNLFIHTTYTGNRNRQSTRV